MSSILLALAPSVPVVIIARLLAGAGQQSCGVGRQAFCAAAVATHHRGRVVGLLGGVSRIGGIAGPLIGGFVAQRYGFRAAFMLQVRTMRFLLTGVNRSKKVHFYREFSPILDLF